MLVSGARHHACLERRQPGELPRIGASCQRCLHSEAHLEIGNADLFPREPGVRARGRLQASEITLRLCAVALDQVFQNGAGLGNGLIAIGDDR